MTQPSGLDQQTTLSDRIAPLPRIPRGGRAHARTRLGWFSTWNSKCGIAEYSRYLLGELDGERFDWTVLASRNDKLLGPDQGRVLRCWTDSSGPVEPLLDVVRAQRFDVLVVQFKIQHDFGFLSLNQLEALIAACHCAGTRVVLVLHATDGADPSGAAVSIPRIAQCLSSADRILVHSRFDVERLRGFGVESEIELFPHGHIDLGPQDRAASRRMQQLAPDVPVIGSHGFLLPHKGIDHLITALALLHASGTRARLLLVNALYPVPASEEYLGLCRRLAAEQGVADDVVFETRFLPREVSLQRLAACDVIVYPYQPSVESVSGAVRLGLATRRPVMCSQLPIFSDVASVVRLLRGTGAREICEDLQEFFSDERGRERLAAEQEAWVEKHSWARVARTLQDRLRPPASREAAGERPDWQYVLDLAVDRDREEQAARSRLVTAESAAQVRVRAVESAAQLRIADLEARIGELGARIGELGARTVELEHSTHHWRSMAEAGARQVQEIYRSSSWRVTRPLRAAGEAAHRLRGTLEGWSAAARTRLRARPRPEPAPAGEIALREARRIAHLNLSPREQDIYLDLERTVRRNGAG